MICSDDCPCKASGDPNAWQHSNEGHCFECCNDCPNKAVMNPEICSRGNISNWQRDCNFYYKDGLWKRYGYDE